MKARMRGFFEQHYVPSAFREQRRDGRTGRPAADYQDLAGDIRMRWSHSRVKRFHRAFRVGHGLDLALGYCKEALRQSHAICASFITGQGYSVVWRLVGKAMPAPGNHRRKPGVVITVLTMAMSTSIVNTFCEMTPRSKPTLMMINSINARVFIRMPMILDSWWFRPDQRAAQ